MLILSALIFLSVALVATGLYAMYAPTRTAQRLQTIGPQEPDGPRWTETIARVTGPFARLSTPEGDWKNSPLRVLFLNAGIRSASAPAIYFGAKTLLPLVFAVATFTSVRGLGSAEGMTLLLYVSVAALVGCYLPNLVLGLAVRSRKREIFESFPDAADLMLVCVEAGQGMDAALTRVADEMRRKCVELAEELHLTNLEIRAGASRDQALRNLAVRTGVEEVATFATMLTQADKFGTSIGDSLRVFSDDLRTKRQMRAEEAAAKVPTKMLFPLVMFIFPSIIMVVLGPAIIQIVRTVMPMIGGKG